MEENVIDYGPLKGLIGVWVGEKGIDVAPVSDGSAEDIPYYETIIFEEGGDLKNAGSQHLTVVSYHQVVTRKATNEVFHDEVGYWIWDTDRKTVMRSFTIPRAVAVVAGGIYDGDVNAEKIVLKIEAGNEGSKWEIAQSPFMQDHAKTVSFECKFTLEGDKLHFYQNTVLDIYGKIFDHSDENELTRKK